MMLLLFFFYSFHFISTAMVGLYIGFLHGLNMAGVLRRVLWLATNDTEA
jgi:hypothetical protein